MDYKQVYSNPLLLKLFKNESEVILKIRGEHVLSAYEVSDDKKNIFVVAPLCDGGDLRKYLIKNGNRPISEEAALNIFR